VRSFEVGSLKEKALSWTTIIATLFLAVSALYLLYGLLAGYLPKYPLFPKPQRIQILQNVKFMLLTFQVSSVVLSGLIVAAHYDDAEKLAWVGLLGILAYVGMPMLCLWSLALHAGTFNYAIKIVSRGFRLSGALILLIVALPALRLVFLSLKEMASRRMERAYIPTAKRVTVRRLSFLSKCWDLPYCRDFLRRRCPAYKAKRTCWKLKRGCYCDPSIIEGLLEGVKDSDIVYQEGTTTRRPTITCRRCPIYLEHQRLKYKAIYPLIYPATGAVMWAIFPALKFLYMKGASALTHIIARFSYAGPGAFKSWEEALSSPFLLGLFIAVAGFLLLLGLIKLTDYLILEVKI